MISRINLAARNRSTSSHIAFLLGSENRRRLCLTGLTFGKTWSVCSANVLSIPGISAGHQTKISQFSRRNLKSALSYAGDRLVDTSAIFDGIIGWTWCALVSLLVLNSSLGAVLRVSGGNVWSVKAYSCSNSSCIPNDSEIL